MCIYVYMICLKYVHCLNSSSIYWVECLFSIYIVIWNPFLSSLPVLSVKQEQLSLSFVAYLANLLFLPLNFQNWLVNEMTVSINVSMMSCYKTKEIVSDFIHTVILRRMINTIVTYNRPFCHSVARTDFCVAPLKHLDCGFCFNAFNCKCLLFAYIFLFIYIW